MPRETAQERQARSFEALVRTNERASLSDLASRPHQDTAPASSMSPLSQRQTLPVLTKRNIKRALGSCGTCDTQFQRTGQYPRCDGDPSMDTCGLRFDYAVSAQAKAGEGSYKNSFDDVARSTSQIAGSAASIAQPSDSATAFGRPTDEELEGYTEQSEAMFAELDAQGVREEAQAEVFESLYSPKDFAAMKARIMGGTLCDLCESVRERR